jgi:hypothetical protein
MSVKEKGKSYLRAAFKKAMHPSTWVLAVIVLSVVFESAAISTFSRGTFDTLGNSLNMALIRSGKTGRYESGLARCNLLHMHEPTTLPTMNKGV